MRILMVIPYANIIGPVPRLAATLINELRVLGCDVLSEHWGRHNDGESLFQKISGRTCDLFRIRRGVSGEDLDVMVIKTAHDWSTLVRDLLLVAFTRRRCRKIVLRFHGSDPDKLVGSGHFLFKALSKFLLLLCDAALVSSSEEQMKWRKFCAYRDFYFVSVPYTPMGRGASKFLPAGLRGHNRPIVLFVGRIQASKGIFDLLKAIQIVNETIECRLVVSGTGPHIDRFFKTINDLKIKSHVTYLGYVDHDRLADVYDAADIFVLPTFHNEGFPTVLIEAMEFGLPIITTKIRGAKDHLVEGVNAVYVAPEDPLKLANAIVELLCAGVLLEKMRVGNREAIKEFSPRGVAAKYLKILQHVSSMSRSGC